MALCIHSPTAHQSKWMAEANLREVLASHLRAFAKTINRNIYFGMKDVLLTCHMLLEHLRERSNNRNMVMLL